MFFNLFPFLQHTTVRDPSSQTSKVKFYPKTIYTLFVVTFSCSYFSFSVNFSVKRWNMTISLVNSFPYFYWHFVDFLSILHPVFLLLFHPHPWLFIMLYIVRVDWNFRFFVLFLVYFCSALILGSCMCVRVCESDSICPHHSLHWLLYHSFF